MRTLTYLALAGAIACATPALAQNDAAAAAANAGANTTVPTNAVTSAPEAPAAPSDQTMTPPPASPTPAETGGSRNIGQRNSFPWGVLGLLGLVGLFGRKRST